MHRFNRYLLLAALVFGLSILLFTIDLGFERSIPDFQWIQEPQPVSTSPEEISPEPITTSPQKEVYDDENIAD